MADTISILSEIRANYNCFDESDELYYRALSEAIEAVKAERKGYWIDIGSGQKCSECEEIQYGYDSCRYYCPNCGADMRGNNDDGRYDKQKNGN